jgi:hypothetical protein
MRARQDQVGFVEYRDDANVVRELSCLSRPDMPAGIGVWDTESGPDEAWTWCFDHRLGANGYEGPRDTSQDGGSVIGGIESMRVDAEKVWTNTADGIKQGTRLLSVSEGNGRSYALRFMVLMTDGVPNRWPTADPGEDQCFREDLWPHPHDPRDRNIDRAKDCVIYYADKAKEEQIAIYTVGLGLVAQEEEDLLMEVARRTGGEYFYAQTAAELEQKLQQIADRIFLRLVG